MNFCQSILGYKHVYKMTFDLQDLFDPWYDAVQLRERLRSIGDENPNCEKKIWDISFNNSFSPGIIIFWRAQIFPSHHPLSQVGYVKQVTKHHFNFGSKDDLAHVLRNKAFL